MHDSSSEVFDLTFGGSNSNVCLPETNSRRDSLADPDYAENLAEAINASIFDQRLKRDRHDSFSGDRLYTAELITAIAASKFDKLSTFNDELTAPTTKRFPIRPEIFPVVCCHVGILSHEYGVRIRVFPAEGEIEVSGADPDSLEVAAAEVGSLDLSVLRNLVERVRERQVRVFVDASNIILDAPSGLEVSALVEVPFFILNSPSSCSPIPLIVAGSTAC